MARPERFELPTFWFVVGRREILKPCRCSTCRPHPIQKSCLRLVHKLVHKQAPETPIDTSKGIGINRVYGAGVLPNATCDVAGQTAIFVSALGFVNGKTG